MSQTPSSSRPPNPLVLSPTHHAMLFAYLARETITREGEARGQAHIRMAVRRYGEQRGHRMALRAIADGLPLTMSTYLAYGEWRAPEGSSTREVLATGPDAHTLVHRCPWHQAWVDADLVQYGCFYCLEIDESLVRGFNPGLTIEVRASQPNGSPYCDFVFREGDLDDLPPSPGPRAVMSWSYHCGHLLSTVGAVLLAELGAVGQEAVRAAIDAFRGTYGDALTELIECESTQDFGILPV